MILEMKNSFVHELIDTARAVRSRFFRRPLCSLSRGICKILMRRGSRQQLCHRKVVESVQVEGGLPFVSSPPKGAVGYLSHANSLGLKSSLRSECTCPILVRYRPI